jgi:plastocyanin
MMPKGIGRRSAASEEIVTKLSLIAPALVAGALLTACGAGGYGTKPAAATSADTAAKGAAKLVEMTESTFSPGRVDLKVGETVSFVDKDEIAHTATADGTFDSGTLREGKRFVFKATKAGTINYVCTFHPGMTGVINVSS